MKKFKFIKLPLKGAYVIEPKPILDQRGFFERLFCQEEFSQLGFAKKIVQINYTLTKKDGIIRGLHLQKAPFLEAKIVTCLQGEIFDCMVDLRKGSPTFLKWHAEILSEKNHRMLYIPEGFAHGLQTLSPNCGVLYFHSNFYQKPSEERIRYDDPKIRIKWPGKIRVISPKDKINPYLKDNFQ